MTSMSVSLIGSFRQHYGEVVRAAAEFESLGVVVRSPTISSIINPGHGYVRFDSDLPGSSDELIQAATIERLLASDFIYVVAPGGYIGRETCYELGRVHQRGTPVFYSERPKDLHIDVPEELVTPVRRLAIQMLECHRGTRSAQE